MKQATTNEFIIVDNPAEPIEFGEMVERNYTVCKPDITRKAEQYVGHVLQTGGPLQIVENLAAIQLFIKEIEKDDRLNDYVVDELNKSQGKATLPTGTKIERIEAGTKYDFSKCGDTVLPALEKQLAEIKRQIAHREQFLKSAPAEGCPIIVDGGEVITVYPPSKRSTTTYKVTLTAKDMTPDTTQDLPF